jgi:nucleotide-binding universal stress UspA family protein
MDVTLAGRRKRLRAFDDYRRLLVPVVDNEASEGAIDVAAQLAADRGASITVVNVVQVPPVLPANAHMRDEEARAHVLLSRAAAIAERRGVGVSVRAVCARDAATTIVDEARSRNAEVIVLGSERPLGETVQHILRKAPCRVMIVGGRTRHRPAA